MSVHRVLAAGAALVGLGVGSIRAEDGPAEYVLKGGTVIDGTGAPGRAADVRIRGERIVDVGKVEPGPGAVVIDASGWVVAPGFIDLHTHSDRAILEPKTRDNRNYQAQGVTTVVTGNCGGGPIDVGRYLARIDAQGAGTNVIHLIPHGSVRAEVMGNADRKANPGELDRMRAIVEKGMTDGAWGMSTGLIYLPGRYADTAELIELAKVVGRHGGIYASHIRDEGAGLLRAIDEALAIGAKAGVPAHISHLKASGKANWGLVEDACAAIERARGAGQKATADQYPYIASSTALGAMVVPHWARQGGKEEFARLADDPRAGPKLRSEIARMLEERDGGASVRIARYAPKPDRVGKTLEEIAKHEGLTPLDVVIDVERHGGAQAISFGMSEQDVRSVMAREYVATASDGGAHVPGGADRPHPRAYGTFPRKIRYALDDKVLPLEAAIRSASGLPAAILGLADRGTLRPDAFADVVVFDPETFRDVATFDDPTRYATGVQYLFVNGTPVIARGAFQDARPGRALRLTEDGPADLILKLGGIWTGDRERPRAKALAARKGEVVAVGEAEEVMRFQGPNTRILDRPGDFAVPGLTDAHAHLIGLGESLEDVDLRGARSPQEVARRVKERAEQQPGDGWILGRSWDQSLWPGQAFPTAADLDAVVADRPVFLVRVDGHAAWVNSRALELAGITAGTEAPPGGEIKHDDRGLPTGILIDAAQDRVRRLVPDPSEADLARLILKAQAEVFRAGLTGIHDAGVGRAEVPVYRKLDADGRLKLRIHGMLAAGRRPASAVTGPPPEAKPGDRFRLRTIKVFIDGAMGSRGALMFAPYADDPGNSGLLLTPPEALEAGTIAALRHGWQVATHAIGDRGNALVLDAYAAARRAVPEATNPRLRIEHAQCVRREDVARFKELGVIASMQPSHASEEIRWTDLRLGADSERVDGAYAMRWFRDAGVPLAFGSDFPVEVLSPFWGIYAAVTRQDREGHPPGGWHPEQRIGVEDALRGFTSGAAYAAFAEGRLGTLSVGKRSDVTIVDRDLLAVPPPEILAAQVSATIVEGEVVYDGRP